MIRFACPACKAPIAVADDIAGKRGKCKHCGAAIEVPQAPSAAVAPRPSVAASPTSPVDFSDRPQNAYAGPNVYATSPAPESKAVHSLGIASMVLGILSFFTCWVPFAGLIFSGLGLLLGLAGLGMSIARKGAGIGYGIAGTAVCLVGLGMGAIFMLFVSGVMAAISEASEEIAVQQARPPAQARPTALSLEPASPTVVDQATSAPPVEAQKPQEPEWNDASQPLALGDIRVSITEVIVGNVPLERIITETQGQSEDELLLVRLKIENTSQRKKLDYSGWMSDWASLRDIEAELTDDADNRYRKINFGTSHVVGAEPAGSIYPNKSLSDAIVFEMPIDGVEYLRLRLTGNAVGEEGEFRFQIPASMIERK
jgi:hypothetical protein